MWGRPGPQLPLGLLFSKPQGSTYLCLLSIGFTLLTFYICFIFKLTPIFCVRFQRSGGHTVPQLERFYFFSYFYFICISVCLHTCMPDAHRGQNRVLDPLEMELYCMRFTVWVLWTESWSPNAASVLAHWAISPASILYLYVIVCMQVAGI